MASETVSSESTTDKRLRRSKRERQPRLNLSMNGDQTVIERPVVTIKSKKVSPVEYKDDQADLYQPGDIVWCKLGSFPWWPALVYRCDAEGGIHTKLLNSNNKPKRQFFVYFYGKYLEYSWISTRWLLKYAGLSNFISYAESAVQKASKKSEQHELANRFQLKVSMKKRMQWDEAIELADHALSLTNNERIKEFSDLLDEAKDTKDQSKTIQNSRKISTEKIIDDQRSVNTSTSIMTRRKPKVFTEDGTKSNEKQSKRKSDQFSSEKTNESITFSNNEGSTKKQRVTRSSESGPILRSNRRSTTVQENEVEYEYPTSTMTADPVTSPFVRLTLPNVPPLSNFEQKQIVEALLKHPKGDNLTLDEAQTFANETAIEIVLENHHYRMTNIAPEWFYDAILLRYPSIAFQYHSWFDHVQIDCIPNGLDFVQLKHWQVALMIKAKTKIDDKTNVNKQDANTTS